MTVSVYTLLAGEDDAWEDSGGGVVSDGNYTSLSFPEWIGWRFPDVDIPPAGSNILTATLRLFPFFSLSIFYNPYVQFWASKDESALDFVADSTISGRARTSASGMLNASGFFAPAYVDVDVTLPVREALGPTSDWEEDWALGIYAFNLSNTRNFPLRFFEFGSVATLTIEWVGDIDIEGTTGSIALTGNAGSSTVVPFTNTGGSTGSIALTGGTGDNFAFETAGDEEGWFAADGSLTPGGAVVEQRGVELLTDPGFEAGTGLFGGFQSTIAQSAAQFHAGAFSLEVTATNTAYSASVTGLLLAGGTFARVFRARCWVRSGTGSAGDVIGLIIRESGGAQPTSETFVTVNLSISWQLMEVTHVVLQNDRTNIEFHAFVPSGATAGDKFYLDDVSLRESPSETGVLAIRQVAPDVYSGAVLHYPGGFVVGVPYRLKARLYAVFGASVYLSFTEASFAFNDFENFVLPAGVWTEIELTYTPTVATSAYLRVGAWDTETTQFYAEWIALQPLWDTMEDLVETGGETGSIAFVGNAGSWALFSPDDDLTYGGVGTYGGDGLYDGPTLEPPPDSGRTRIDIYGPDGTKLAIPPITTFTATYMDAIDEVGSFSFTIPASLESAALVTQGMRLHLFVESEGEVFRGIAREFTWEDGPEGDPRLRVEGPSIGDDFVAANMLLGRTYLDKTPLEMMTDMLSIVSGWALGAVATTVSPPTTSVSAEGASVFGAMRQVAERFHLHTRINLSEQTIDMGPFGAPSGLRLTNLPVYEPSHRESYPKIVPVISMQVVEQGHDVWNSILPHGAGEGTATLTLEHSSRTEPYTIMTAVAPDGRALFYLEDAASIAAYGRRQRVIVDKHAVPLESSEEALEAASDALYDAGVEYLLTSRQPTHTYRVTPGPMKHLVDGVPQFRLGDTVAVTFRGRAELVDGSGYLYLDINQNLYLSSYRRSLGADESTWDLDVQDVLGRREDPARRLADMMDQLWSTQVEPLLADTNMPGEDHPDLPALSYTVTIDARRVFWVTKAVLTFTILGSGAWAGTVTINGIDQTTTLGGPFTAGVEYVVDVKAFTNRLSLNTIVFADSVEFQIRCVKETSGVGLPGQLPAPP